MKLINPTLDELERAFATEVCGWMWREERGGAWFDKSDDPNPDNWVRIINGDGGDIALRGWPNWTRSFDAVLPWLDRRWHCQISHGWTVLFISWTVRIMSKENISKQIAMGESTTLPLAAVIALLRAHGVEVEFTK